MRKMRKYRDYLIEELSDPEEAIAHLQIALEEYQKDGDSFVFLMALQSVVEAQGKRSELAFCVYLLRGLVYHSQKEYERAIENYTKVIEMNPDYADAYYNRGVVYRDKGEVDRAIADHNRAIQLNPGYADVSYNCDLIYGDKQRVEERLVKEKNVSYNRDSTYGDKRELNHAMADFAKAIGLNLNCDSMRLASGASH